MYCGRMKPSRKIEALNFTVSIVLGSVADNPEKTIPKLKSDIFNIKVK
jgi:hypothetical protein